MEIELKLVVEHSNDDLLHELNFSWTRYLLHTSSRLVITLAD